MLNEKTLLGQGSPRASAQDNPEELESRGSKLCRDFDAGRAVGRICKSKHGTFRVLVDKVDEDILSRKGFYVSCHREKGGYKELYPVVSWNGKASDSRDVKFLHLLVAERALGRKKKKIENVHHLDGNHFDCRRRKLLVLKNGEHRSLHNEMSREFAKQTFGGSSCSGDRLDILEKLLGCNTQRVRGILIVR